MTQPTRSRAGRSTRYSPALADAICDTIVSIKQNGLMASIAKDQGLARFLWRLVSFKSVGYCHLVIAFVVCRRGSK